MRSISERFDRTKKIPSVKAWAHENSAGTVVKRSYPV